MKQIEIKGNQLVISSVPAPIIIQGILGFMLLIIIGLIVLIFHAMTDGNGLHIGFFIGIGFLGFLGWRMIRILLWNRYGKEILTIEENKLKYIADYGQFQDGAQEMELDSDVICSLIQSRNDSDSYISFSKRQWEENDKKIDSAIKLNISSDKVELNLLIELSGWLANHQN